MPPPPPPATLCSIQLPGPLSSQLAKRTKGTHSNPDEVVFTKSGMQNIIDSLRRARTAAEAAESLCSKAARAFAEESRTIDECKQVVESYVRN